MGLGLALASMVSTASAASLVTPTPNLVIYINSGGALIGGIQYIQIQVGTKYYYAASTPATGCGSRAVSMDSVKQMQAVAVAAMLAGKRLNVSYLDCGNQSYIYALGIQ